MFCSWGIRLTDWGRTHCFASGAALTHMMLPRCHLTLLSVRSLSHKRGEGLKCLDCTVYERQHLNNRTWQFNVVCSVMIRLTKTLVYIKCCKHIVWAVFLCLIICLSLNSNLLRNFSGSISSICGIRLSTRKVNLIHLIVFISFLIIIIF